MPAISNPDEEDAISLMSAIYANTITNHVQKHLSLENLTQESIRLQNQVEKLKKLQQKHLILFTSINILTS
jgi:Mg2+ and Co2+ transporter CorA